MLPGMAEWAAEQGAKQQAAEKVAAKKRHEEWAASLLKSMVERQPPTAAEWDVMLGGIRLSRFVSHLECEECRLATEDHSIDWIFETLVCLKDYYRVISKPRKRESSDD